MWPSIDMSKDDCRKSLRILELEAYGKMVDVLRAQGHFSVEKKKLLSDVATALSIPIERHKAEIRRAVNDERLTAVAEVLVGPNTSTDWAIEGRRMIPLLPRPQQNTVFTIVADECADYVSTEREAASEGAFKAAGSEFPFSVEPSSPEPSKTPASPSGLIVFPSGQTIEMKKEVEEDESDRKKRKAPVEASSASPPPHKIVVGAQQQITMSSRTIPSPFPPGSTPLKIALPAGSARAPTTTVQTFNSTAKQVIIVSSSTSPNTPSILQKTLSVPIKTPASKSTVMYSQSSTSPEVFKQRPKSMQSTPIGKPRPNTIVVSQKTPVKTMTTTKQGMPMQSKFVVQQKAVPRGVQKPTQLMVQQKPGKPPVMANVQVKTAQGFANVPMQMRPGAKHVQIKTDSPGGPVKMVSISGAAKILPKPSQPLYVVTTTTGSFPMVPRTVPAACPPRVVNVSTGSNLKWSQSPLGGKSLPTMHVMTQQRRADGVVLVQKGASGKAIIPHSIKESPINKGNIKTIAKPVTTTMSPQLAQSLQQISTANPTQGGTNVILLDISNQEKTTALADFLQASGIIHESDVKTVAIGVGSGNDSADDSDKQEKTEIVLKEETATVPSLSIEEAVEMLNRSDTPETRALLSQAGIQISDEIADSEEEEQIIDKSMENQTAEIKMEEVPIKGQTMTSLDSSEEGEVGSSMSLPETAVSTVITLPTPTAPPPPPPPPTLPTAVHTLSTRPRSLDIFTTALASANINLDSFMEEEDDPEPAPSIKDEMKQVGTKENETNDSSSDPLDEQLAELRGDMSQ